MTLNHVNGAMPPVHSDVQLCITVPIPVREAVRAAAKKDKCTVRTVTLRALRDAGLIEIADDKLANQRAIIATEKARLYRERGPTRA